MHFGATLRLLRVDAGFTLRDLAERVGVSNAYLSRVEHGHDAPPTPDRLVALARAFGLPPTALIALADRVAPVAADYFEAVPAARELMLEVVRRKLTATDIARVRAFLDREFPDRDAARGDDDVASMLDPSRVVIGLSCTDLEDVVDVAATRLVAETSATSAADLASEILRREAACATALGGGVSVPHALVRGVRPSAVVVTLRRPMRAETPDGAPLQLVVVHVHPGGRGHTSALARIARIAERRVVNAVAALRSPSAVVEALTAALA